MGSQNHSECTLVLCLLGINGNSVDREPIRRICPVYFVPYLNVPCAPPSGTVSSYISSCMQYHIPVEEVSASVKMRPEKRLHWCRKPVWLSPCSVAPPCGPPRYSSPLRCKWMDLGGLTMAAALCCVMTWCAIFHLPGRFGVPRVCSQ